MRQDALEWAKSIVEAVEHGAMLRKHPRKPLDTS